MSLISVFQFYQVMLCFRSLHVRVATDHSTVLVLQEQRKKEAGLGEDAAALFCHFIPCLLPISLQQVQQRFHRVFHQIHRIDRLVVLREETKRKCVKERERTMKVQTLILKTAFDAFITSCLNGYNTKSM